MRSLSFHPHSALAIGCVLAALVLGAGTAAGGAGSGSEALAPRCGAEYVGGGVSPVPPLRELRPAALDSLLLALHASAPRFADRLRALALARLDTPYVLGPLGEGSPEDEDPVFRVDQVDCTVLVLTTVAMAAGKSTTDSERWMGPANYRRQGDAYPVRYANRLHFTEDRLSASPLFADLTRELARPDEIREVELVLNRRADGRPLLPIDWQRAATLAYVPAASLSRVLARAPELCGLAFVRESFRDRGLLVAHEGFLLDRRCLLHASSEAGRAVLVDVLDYLFRVDDPDPARAGQPRFDGAIVFALRDGAGAWEPAAEVQVDPAPREDAGRQAGTPPNPGP
jgi:Protein of unknown function (DUF1460)